MLHEFLLNINLKKFFTHYNRVILYTVILGLVAFGHYYLMQISYESFRYIRQSVLSMICFLCFCGVFVLLKQKRKSRADSLFVALLFIVGFTNLLSLISGLTTGYSGVVNYEYMSFSLLIYGSVFAYLFLLYPLEAFRPGWLTIKRALVIFLPTLAIMVIYLIKVRVLGSSLPAVDDWSSLLNNFWDIGILMRLLIMVYPVIGVVIMLLYRSNYVEWCENNYASMEEIDVKWLEDYIFGNLVITFSCEVVVFSNNVQSVLMHSIVSLVFMTYSVYRVFFHKNPYPEGYFEAGMNEWEARLREEMGALGRLYISNGEKIVSRMSVEELNNQSFFIEKLPVYKKKLEQWMITEKPHLRKNFKLTDTMEILPLNRTCLFSLFNVGYEESFYHFVKRYRIAESKRLLLLRPDMAITCIADLSGFSSVSVFCRAFADEMNCSPMQWRESELMANSPAV